MANNGYKGGPLPLLRVVLIESLFFTVILFPLCYGSDGRNGPSCMESERRALLAVKSDINITGGWLSSWRGNNCCSWRGVSCENTTGHVVQLHLRYPYTRNLEYPDLGPSKVNPSLFLLTHLEYLDLSMNNFDGAPITESIATLQHLQYLNLSYALFNGTVPRQLGNLSNLHFLDLHTSRGDRYSLLADSLHWLSRVPSLQYLDLSGVDLSKAVDWLHDVNIFPSLTVLRLSSTNLANIPATLPNLNLTSLEVLDLSSNYFNSTIPRWLFNISSSLVQLILSTSGLHGEIPLAIGDFISMQHLDLSTNELSGEIPETLGNLSRLEYLDLSGNQIGGVIPGTVGGLKRLRFLKLFLNQIGGEIPDTVGKLGNMESLDLRENRISGSIPDSIGELRNLLSLSLTGNEISGSIPKTIGNLRRLQSLDLSFNSITGNIPESLGNLTNLQEVIMTRNNISGQMPETMGNLHNLNHLEMPRNNFSGVIPSNMGNLCKLDHLELSQNNIGGSITALVDGLSRCIENKQSAGLTRLLLGINRLNGTVPESLGRLSSLVSLELYSNSFVGALTETHFAKLANLSGLDLSFNSLEMRVSEDWVPPFNATGIRLCACQMGPKFPAWLQTQKGLSGLSDLCLSEAGIIGTIPPWLWDLLDFYEVSLNISHNKLTGTLPGSVGGFMFASFDVSYNSLEGPVPQLSTYSLSYVHLSNNLFSGPIPQSFFSEAATSNLDVFSSSNNRINGSIPSFFCNLTGLRVLDLSGNDLSGGIPDCWDNSSWLSVVDFSNNSLSGRIPASIGSLTRLQSLHLSKNSLYGKIPSSLRHCNQLATLDLGENHFSGNIPTWIATSLSLLRVLNLRKNSLDGPIPEQLSQLTSLQVLDLSHNNLQGIVPGSLANLSAMIGRQTSLGFDKYRFYFYVQGFNDYYYGESLLMVKNGTEYVYSTILSLVTSIDLSSNNLSGEIPKELTDLSGLLFLNLSSNHFSGKIPENIGALSQLELLDLSMNDLSGKIPPSLGALTFLNQLKLSHNNLSGRIPSGSQLQTFAPSAFEGNPGLCGPPVLQQCSDDTLSPGSHQTGGQEEEGDEDESETIWVYFGFAPGFAIGFWAFMAAMMGKKTRRMAYIRWIDVVVSDWVYKVATVCSARLKSIVTKCRGR